MRRSYLTLLILLFCSGCWDMKEINQLAIVNIAGADKDPSTGMITAYYQIINPSGVSIKSGGASGGAVYTYELKEYSSGRFAEQTTTVMPRLFYTPHVQLYIVSERYAQQGLLDLINFLERDPERRTNVNIVVTDSPLSTVMNSYTFLERVPGRFVKSMFDLHARSYRNGIMPTRFRDLAKGINYHQPTIIPILHYKSEQPASKTDRLENINASTEAMSFEDGAVFLNARMVGRIDLDTKKYFFILNDKLKKFVESIEVNGENVDVEVQDVKMNREFNRSSSRLTIQIRAELRIVNSKQPKPMTVDNLHEVESAFNRTLEEKAKSLDQLGKDKDWDLLGIQDEGVNIKNWKELPVTFVVNSKVTTIGNTGSPYKVEKSE
ncbi:MAG: Ger(x)C family spore germination C-terminal domain-containing protein [Bacillota bacterium]